MKRRLKVLTHVVALTYKNRLIHAQKRQVGSLNDERGGSRDGETPVRVGVLLQFKRVFLTGRPQGDQCMQQHLF